MKPKLMRSVFVVALFIFYMYALFRIILFKFRSRDLSFLMDQLERNFANLDILMFQLQRGNFTPFQTIFINIHSLSGWHDLSNFVGNIVAFTPFGIFLVLLSKKRLSYKGVITLSFCLSLLLECFQVIFSLGIMDVDDLILNTFGGLLGYFVMKLYEKVVASMQLAEYTR